MFELMMRTRERVWEIVEVARDGDAASRRFDMFILNLIGLNVLAVMLQSIPALESQFAGLFFAFELFSVAVFSVEYLARLWSCVEEPEYRRPILGRLRFALRPMVLIDLLAILPFLVSFAAFDLRILRAFRLLRLVRLLKATRYVAAAKHFRSVMETKREELVLTTGLMTVLLIITASVMYFAENAAQPDKFGSIPESLWWAVATLTTVGYGDVYPITPLGRIAAGFIAIVGIGFLALPTAILGSGFVEAIEADKKDQICPHCGGRLK